MLLSAVHLGSSYGDASRCRWRGFELEVSSKPVMLPVLVIICELVVLTLVFLDFDLTSGEFELLVSVEIKRSLNKKTTAVDRKITIEAMK